MIKKNRSDTVKLDGVDTYFEIYGVGDPLFVLHGWTESSARWQDYIPHFADHFQVIIFDLLGHGKSSPLQGEFSLHSSADNLLALMDHLRIRKAKAIGFSYGGETLLQFSSIYADRLDSMVLIGASYDFPKQDWGMYFSYNDISPERMEQYRKIHVHGDDQIKEIFEQTRNYECVLTESQLEKISTNTLIIVGEYDRFVGLEIPLQLRRSLPNSHLWIIPNAEHTAFAGNVKQEFIRVANEFLKDEWNE